jgi:hypothetical protein
MAGRRHDPVSLPRLPQCPQPEEDQVRRAGQLDDLERLGGAAQQGGHPKAAAAPHARAADTTTNMISIATMSSILPRDDRCGVWVAPRARHTPT